MEVKKYIVGSEVRHYFTSLYGFIAMCGTRSKDFWENDKQGLSERRDCKKCLYFKTIFYNSYDKQLEEEIAEEY